MPSIFSRKKDKGSESPGESRHASRVPRLDAEPARLPTASQAVPPPANVSPQKRAAKDLWSEAFAALSPEDCEALRSARKNGKPGDAIPQRDVVEEVEEVMQLTEVSYQNYCRRGWHTKKGETTKETNVRIKAKEIICSALQFKDIVDAGLKFDPSGYGIVVWGVLSGVLTLVKNDKEKIDAVFNSAAVMARFLPKYAIIENHYRDRATQKQNAFEDQIEQVYVAILKYAACVQKELNRSVAGRLLDSFWTLDNQDVQLLKVNLEGKDKIVTEQSQFVAHQYRKQEFQELDRKASEALGKIEISVEKLLKAERLSTLKWLSDTPLMDKQQQLRSQVDKANKNSGNWLLESSGYTDWLTEPHSFVWLHGASGSGKSCLCSTVVKSLVESAENNSNMIVAYWYFDNADRSTQILQRLLRLVLRRISAKATPFPEAVGDLANKHELPDSSPSTATLIKALKETVATLEEDMFLVLDAIDEYQTGNETLLEEFLDFLVGLGDAQIRKLHLLVTSITDTDTGIKNAFKRLQKPPAEIDVEKPISVDVDAYLKATIKKDAEDKHWSPEIMHKIYNALKDDGRFRIVSLQLEDLRKCYDEDEIDAALTSIPFDIEDAYLRKLQSVAPKDVRRLSHIFYWISVAVRQLTTSELAAAPGINLPSLEELPNICPNNMIRMEEQKPFDVDRHKSLRQQTQKSSGRGTEIVTFDHPSVKRFLYSRKLQQSSDSRISPFFVSEKTVHTEFSGLMIDHLLAIKQPRLEPSIFVKNPFLPYLAQHWHQHLKGCGDILDENDVLKDKLLILFEEPMNPAYLNWIRVWNPESRMQNFGLTQDSCPSPLYMAVLLKLEAISKHLIDNRSYINGAGGLMHTTLQLASQRGYTGIAQNLIAAGENVDKTAGDQPTALHSAVENGDGKLVQMLLRAGASPDVEHALFDPPLQLASSRGFTNIVGSLVGSGADVNLQSGRFGTALQAAAAAGHSETVAFLLEQGAKPDVVGGLLGTAFQAAAAGGHSEVVKTLTAKGHAWDEGRDSIWHEAYDLWISWPSKTRYQNGLSFLSRKPSVGPDIQWMLADILKTLSSLPAADNGRASHTKKKHAALILDALRTKWLKLVELALRQGQEGMDSANYVYRALFWAMLCRCTEVAQNLAKIDPQSAIQETLYRLSTIIVLRTSDQNAIEHGTSDAMMMTELDRLLFSRSNVKDVRIRPSDISMMLEGVEQQDKRFESVMKMARLQEPFTEAALLDRMHRELLAKMQQEIRGCFQTLEEGMQKRLEEVEQGVVASIGDRLPGIILEEMRKLLVEQKG
ncbi:MAG: hypothetical protein Q9157_005686 [Trypethelium eluteriae]